MPMFQIEQYELHCQTYSVEADSEAEAISKLLNGGGEPLDGALEFIEVAGDRGLSVHEHRQLADKLGHLGMAMTETVIPSIRSIEEA